MSERRKTAAQYLTDNLNSERDTSRCRFDREGIVFVVERADGRRDLTCPFVAQNEAHAIQWTNQPHAKEGKFKSVYTRYVARFCHCGTKKIIRKARAEE